MPTFTEEQIKGMATTREYLWKKIQNKREELEILTNNLHVIDAILSESSFKPASQLTGYTTAAHEAGGTPAATNEKQLKRLKDDFLLANCTFDDKRIIIVPAPGVTLNVNTKPFDSFFIQRILQGIKNKHSDMIWTVETSSESNINKIIIDNYGGVEQRNEIWNTAAWVFSRMLEK